MEQASFLLTVLIFSPLLAIVFLFFVPNKDQQTVKILGFLGTLPSLFLSSWLLLKYHQGFDLSTIAESRQWLQFGFYPEENNRPFSVRYELGVNGFSLLMIWLTALLSTLSAVASFRIKEKVRGYYGSFFLLLIGMLGVFAAENLVLFFLFFELTLVSLFFIIGKWGGFEKEKAAYAYLLYNGLGSGILFIVIATIFAKTGTTNIEELTTFLSRAGGPFSSTVQQWLLITLLVAFGIKLPIFPFHRWMLKVHVQAPPAIVMLHSGILLKIGAYGLIRFGIGFFPEAFASVSQLLLILGLINLLFGAFLALIQTEFKLVLAYSSVSHMGIVLLGLGAINDAGLQGAIFQVVSHGLISAMLFFIVNIMEERLHTTDLKKLGGVAGAMPKLSGFLLIAAMASLGLPSMSGFISELTAFIGVFAANKTIGFIGVLGLILTAAYMLRAVLSVTFGSYERPKQTVDMKWVETASVMTLLVFIIGLGVYPKWVADSVIVTVQTMLRGIGG
ncbi:NADH-quinone oxidoreductase subunit M [Bacillus sp. FJAT-47783]|uniref:complex I subunit 4 family protein n=1 Tax=Bacillus sp. FJAT-47783 TaxID=2922712 RepID=UPI001FAC744B|nr:NADH-quinone oxidoreductase subunit M [Bacillus sp. FJAT-47783]